VEQVSKLSKSKSAADVATIISTIDRESAEFTSAAARLKNK
jgi:hypothetical protein